jgi:hypothetical protein
VAVLGSTQPWYEALALSLGARRVVTVELKKNATDPDSIKALLRTYSIKALLY